MVSERCLWATLEMSVTELRSPGARRLQDIEAFKSSESGADDSLAHG